MSLIPVASLCTSIAILRVVFKSVGLRIALMQERRLHFGCDVSAARLRIGVHLGQERPCGDKLPRYPRRFGPPVIFQIVLV